MKKSVIAGVALLLAACGDETTINQTGLEVVGSTDDLPKCSAKNKGEQVLVTDDAIIRVCVDGEWLATKSGDADDFSCKTVELKDGSGLKIVCNGDSIGVVLNGSDGKDGKSGKDGKDGEDAVISQDPLENDSERVAISLDSLVGYTQKGPFLKGSTVYLYELSDGRTLKQTNGNFTSNIARDDGRYKFNARDLVSQYAMIVVDGYYRNEVTGNTSDAPIRLKAITDMRKHNSVNVNILTHLEFERVYNLVTREHKTVKAAKKQAQKEILKIFDIELAEGADAEDLDVFGSSDADAALLAVSIMLQGDRTESELMALLSEISDAIVEKGEWTGARADSIKTGIADWIMAVDGASGLDSIRKHVEGWHLSTEKIPAFEKLVRNFASKQLLLGLCGEGDNSTGYVKFVTKTNSAFYVESYEDTASIGKMHRFICIDAENIRWRPATGLEKDGFDWKSPIDSSGKLLTGRVTGKTVVWDADTLRYADSIEIDGGKGCVSYGRDSVYILDHQYSYYKCEETGWKYTLDTLNWGSLYDKRDGKTYKTIGVKTQMWMAENLNYEFPDSEDYYGESYCLHDEPDSCAKHGRLYTWFAANNTRKVYAGDGRYAFLPWPGHVCPAGWHLPSKDEWEIVINEYKSEDGNHIGFDFDCKAGYRSASGYSSEGVGCYAILWSSTRIDNDSAYSIKYFPFGDVNPTVSSNDMDDAYPIRCVMD